MAPGQFGNESVIPGGAHGQHTTASPQKRTLNSWRKAPAFPTKVKTRDRGEEAVAWGLPRALSHTQPESLERTECLLHAGCTLQLPANSGLPSFLLPHSTLSPLAFCRPRARLSLTSGSSPLHPTTPLHPGHYGALSPHLNPFPLRCQLSEPNPSPERCSPPAG